MRKLSELPPEEKDEVLFEVCKQFLNNQQADRIAAGIAALVRDHDVSLSREQVYPLLREACKNGYLHFCPPAHKTLAQRIADRFRAPIEKIHVLNVRGAGALEHVAEMSADLALQLIKEVGAIKRGEPVHVGLGAGYTTMNAARRLGYLLRHDHETPSLVFHALSSGFLVHEPLMAPIAYFSFFNDASVDVKCVGLFAEAVVSWDEYERVKTLPGVRESFEEAKKIDIVITSMASADDEGGLLNQFMKHDQKGMARLRKADWIGDVQFRPFSPKGPILVNSGIRAVTVLELEDLINMSTTPAKHVILVCGPPRRSQVSRSKALRSLLEEPALRVWTHVVTDLETARSILDGEPRE